MSLVDFRFHADPAPDDDSVATAATHSMQPGHVAAAEQQPATDGGGFPAADAAAAAAAAQRGVLNDYVAPAMWPVPGSLKGSAYQDQAPEACASEPAPSSMPLQVPGSADVLMVPGAGAGQTAPPSASPAASAQAMLPTTQQTIKSDALGLSEHPAALLPSSTAHPIATATDEWHMSPTVPEQTFPSGDITDEGTVAAAAPALAGKVTHLCTQMLLTTFYAGLPTASAICSSSHLSVQGFVAAHQG
jgi:hypothetical protein